MITKNDLIDARVFTDAICHTGECGESYIDINTGEIYFILGHDDDRESYVFYEDELQEINEHLSITFTEYIPLEDLLLISHGSVGAEDNDDDRDEELDDDYEYYHEPLTIDEYARFYLAWEQLEE